MSKFSRLSRTSDLLLEALVVFDRSVFTFFFSTDCPPCAWPLGDAKDDAILELLRMVVEQKGCFAT